MVRATKRIEEMTVEEINQLKVDELSADELDRALKRIWPWWKRILLHTVMGAIWIVAWVWSGVWCILTGLVYGLGFVCGMARALIWEIERSEVIRNLLQSLQGKHRRRR